MDGAAARGRLEGALAGWLGSIRLDVDDFGNVLVFVRRDMTHLDADALNDRLHAWIAREVRTVIGCASAFVSFRSARPASLDEAELDHQEVWRDVEPTLRLDTESDPTAADVDHFATLVPRFLSLVEGSGRPVGWRDVHAGNAE